MAKFVCSVCGYVYEGEQPPEKCPQCGVPADKFIKQGDDKTWAAEHVVGVAQGAPEDIMAELQRRVLRGWYVSGNGSCCSSRGLS